MAEMNESKAAPEPQSGSQSGVGGWIGGVFLDPRATFEKIADSTERPHPTKPGKTKDMSRWWLPLIITIIVGIVVALYTVPKFVGPMQYEAIRESVMERGGTEEQVQQAISMTSAMLVPMSLVGVIVMSVVILFIAAGIAHLLMKMTGGKGRFRVARAVVAWSMLVTTLGSIVKLPLMVVKDSMFVETSPTLFFANLEPSDRLYRFLTTLDIFTLWWLVLLVVGLAVGYRTSYGKSTVAVVFLWILTVLITVFTPGGMGAGM
jgi:hypothetical protein